MAKTKDAKRKRERANNERELANRYARAFVTLAERSGPEVSLELSMKLVELFGDAMATGAALEKDYAKPEHDEMRAGQHRG